MIRLTDVRKIYPTRFGDRMVLDRIGFELAKGERLGVLGRNGAGKSTMVRLISGAERPTSGTIERHMSVSWPLAFGGAFQAFLTGRDNVRFISRIYGQDFEENLEFVEKFSELGQYLGEPVRTYSSGMRARLAFAISMIIEFDCFLIDEITAVGDARFQARCNFELFENRGDRAMIIISHDASYIRDHCTRWAILEEGKLIEYDDFDQAYSDFKGIIGIGDRAAATTESMSIALAARDRLRLLEYNHRTSLTDDHFNGTAREADWARDHAELSRQYEDWKSAETLYAEALDRFPYSRVYWIQHGHAAKEQTHFARAEISYRTGSAMGLPLLEVAVHQIFVMEQQGVSVDEFPVRNFNPGPLPHQLPGEPDVDLLGRILWNTAAIEQDVMLDLLRRHGSFDELIAAMIESPRFSAGHVDPDRSPGTNASEPAISSDAEPVERWLEYVVATYLPEVRGGDRVAMLKRLAATDQVLPILIENHAFDDFERTKGALKRRYAWYDDLVADIS